MFNYFMKKILLMLPIIWGVATIVFVLKTVLPGDPARLLVGQHGDAKNIELLRKKMGLDKPIYEQYINFMGDLFQGDLGYSFRKKRDVTAIIADRYYATMKLATIAIIFASIFGISAGILAAMKQNTIWDGLVMVLSLAGISTPVFWLALMAILLFSTTLQWFPTYGYGDGDFAHIVLPAFSLSMLSTGYIARMTRSSMLEVIRQDFVRTARAKGLSTYKVILKHTLKNAMIPVITIIGITFAQLLGGAIVTEYVFSWPGVGKLIVDAINLRDMPLVNGGVILFAATFLVVNLAVDLIYGFFDPRIRFD
ncbi:MAG: ABC transporter permease [Calditrichaeota bacterium]|nr:MAG: ABC transporter permease [Calditrichota bacterium]